MFERCFSGDLVSCPPSAPRRALGDWARKLVLAHFGASPADLSAEEFRQALSGAREAVGEEPEGRSLAISCLAEAGIELDHDLFLDTLRLRAVSPGLERNPAAAPAFYAHRDTWYGNPRGQLNGWMPLVEVDERNSFRFYLDAFETPVENDSHLFDGLAFLERGGFGRTASDPVSPYPRALQPPAGRVHDVVLAPDSLLFFSAAHLHQTLPNQTATPRFSLDFRFFRLSDLQADRGAPDPDNRSRGGALQSYLPCR